MIGTTGLKQLHVDCIVGIYQHERERTQAVLVDIEIDYDFGPAAASDAIPEAVDYDDTASSVTALIQTRQFQLIETMVEEAAAMLLERIPKAVAVRVEIRKPAAVPEAAYSYVRVERSRA